MRWKVLGLIAFAIVIAAFTLANTTEVSVNFVVVTAKTNLVLVILLSVLLGMILMAILWSLRAWKLRGQVGTLKKRLAQVEGELEACRKHAEDNVVSGGDDEAVSETTSAGEDHSGTNEPPADGDTQPQKL